MVPGLSNGAHFAPNMAGAAAWVAPFQRRSRVATTRMDAIDKRLLSTERSAIVKMKTNEF
jgi:hypothetical protein